MANLDLLENSIPVAPLKLAALPGSMEMAKKVDAYLVQFRKELAERRNGVSFSGYSEDSFLIDCECPRFGSGEAKGKINESVRGADLYILVDVCNYSITYNVCGHENHMSPDDHYQDLKRIISAATGKAHRINVVIPFLYEGRQHRRTSRESLDCALALQELVAMGVENDGYVLPRELKKGDTVLIADLGKEATVLSPVDRNGNVEVLAGAAKTRVKLKNLRLIENAPKKRSPNSGARRTGVESKMNMDASARLDVRGLTVDDCIMELDRYIDYMLRMGLGEFTIVHGKGTGALRSAVNQYLRKSPYVKSFRLGVYGEGEDGVTIVVLK